MRPALGSVSGGPQNVAGVTVAVQAYGLHPASLAHRRCTPRLAHQGEGLLTERRPFCPRLRGHRALIEQPLARLIAKGLHIQRGALGKGAALAHVVDAGQKATNPLQHLGVVQLGLPPASARADTEPKTRVLWVVFNGQMVQAFPVQCHGRHHRDVFAGQFTGKSLLFSNQRLGPAQWPIKLGHHGTVVVEHGQVNPVFVRAQSAQAAIHRQAQIGQGIQDPQWRQGLEKRCHRLTPPKQWVVERARSARAWR